jgi:cyclase
LFAGGVEKVIIGSQAVENPQLVTDISRIVGAQSVVVCIDVKRNWLGRRRVHVRNGTKDTGLEPVELAKRFEQLGAGEIILQSIDNDGRMEGFDVALIREVASSVSMPVVACGGAGKLSDFSGAIAAGASGVAGGSFFVFYGKHRAVLITYPSQAELKNLFTQLAG